jgi:hypothetical protein
MTTPQSGGRKRTRAQPYKDPSSSEFDSEDVGDDDDEESLAPAQRGGRQATGRAKSNPRSPHRSNKKMKTTDSSEQSPVPEAWPKIEAADIAGVTRDILDRLVSQKGWFFAADVHVEFSLTLLLLPRQRTADEDGIFAEPVVMAYPDIADEYLDAIEEPMDFQTIQKTRLPSYRSITELQGDLMLVFNNCIVFNQRKNDYGEYAR